MSENKVKINILCCREVTYNQEIDVTEKEYDKLLELEDVDEVLDHGKYKDQFNIIDKYINPTNVFDSLNMYKDIEVTLADDSEN